MFVDLAWGARLGIGVVTVHGWVCSLRDGLIRDLHVSMDDRKAIADAYGSALARLLEEVGRLK